MINRIVDRCHVSMSNSEVIRYVVSRLANGYTTWHAVSRSDRKAAMRAIIARHQHNRDVYRYVMTGRR